MFDPPPSYKDMESDALDAPSSSHYHDLDVPGVGIVSARKPMANAVHALSQAASADIEMETRVDYLLLFARNHIADGELDRLLFEMTDPDSELPQDTLERVARSIATWGTARPTVPSSR